MQKLFKKCRTAAVITNNAACALSFFLIGFLSAEAATAQGIVFAFSKVTGKRSVVFANCAIVPGTTKITVKKGGTRIALPRELGKKPLRLAKRYEYFACGDVGNGEDSLFARETVASQVVEFDFGLEDFEDRPPSKGGNGGNGGSNGGGGGNGGSTPSGGLNQVCSSVRDISGSEIYKTRGSDHFSDCRRSTVGFIVAPGGQGVSSSCIPVYDSEGNEIYELGGYYPAGPPWRSRHYGCIGCSNSSLGGSSLAARARSNTGSSSVYLKVSGSQCIRIPDAARCYNSSSC